MAEKILMLGWEYPPHIAGGLGMACEGLTRGLARLGLNITFVVPRLFGGEDASHMNLIDPLDGGGGEEVIIENGTIEKFIIPAFLKPYWGSKDFKKYMKDLEKLQSEGLDSALQDAGLVLNEKAGSEGSAHYGNDIFDEIARFTARIVAGLAGRDFDLIHAHDWMTFPAGVALSRITGKPLLLHVHSVEFDRSGHNANPLIWRIEKMGLDAAQAVITVSHYTKKVVSREYDVDNGKIHVVHNGIYPKNLVKHYRKKREWPSKVVLFLGRITFQKGPDYFVRAAAKVIPHVDDVLFVMAGSGDMLPRMIDLAHELGVIGNFRFPGFLKEKEVEEVFSAADLYVMPSVSEPFGLSALEAINFDTPVLISKQSGVAEVLGHALKFDFWDVDRLADLMINGLLHDDLRADMVRMARDELRNLRWDVSAMKTSDIYHQLA